MDRFSDPCKKCFFTSLIDVGSHYRPLLSAKCHGHACLGRVAHGRMPMTSQTLVMSFHSIVFPFVILGRMTSQKYQFEACQT